MTVNSWQEAFSEEQDTRVSDYGVDALEEGCEDERGRIDFTESNTTANSYEGSFTTTMDEDDRQSLVDAVRNPIGL